MMLGGTGCVQIYQPMSGLHRPVIVDTQAPNFTDVRMTVFCAPGELVSAQEAGVLCDRVRTLFENQGATVRAITSAQQLTDDPLIDTVRPQAAIRREKVPDTDLYMELRSRLIHESDDSLSWALCYLTFTLVPAVTESTFAQDVTIRDGTGFLLVQDTLQGRLIRRFGAGAWAANKVLNLLVRSEEDKLTEETAGQDLSEDLYRQLSQLAFNAKMQWQVLQEGGTSWR